jgi:hypothetical protein
MGLLYRSIDITQATAPPWIGKLATALTSFHALAYHPGNVGSPLRANVVPYRPPIKIKTVAEWYRVLRFLDSHPNLKLVFGDDLFSGRRYIDNIAVR